MKTSKAFITVSLLAALFAVIQSGFGLFWNDAGDPFTFTTLHGETLQMYGQGIYAHDTSFKAPINRGTDAVTLFVAVPVLLIALVYTSRGSLRAKFFLAGVLSYLLYNSASVGFGVAYNNLFLVYIAYFSSSLFAFILTLTTFDLEELSVQVSSGIPRQGIAALLFFSAAGLLAAWLPDIIIALLEGRVVNTTSYTTEVTHLIDLGIIVPVCILAGLQTLRRSSLGYLLSSTLLILLVIIGIVVTTQTVFQSFAGITLPAGAFIGKAGSFILLAVIAVGLLVGFFRGVPGRKAEHGTRMQPLEA